MGTGYQPDVIESGQSYATILSTPLILGLYTSDASFLYKGHCEADLVTPKMRLLSHYAKISTWGFQFAITENERDDEQTCGSKNASAETWNVSFLPPAY